MELRHIRYFLAVAEELNFTRAAAKLGIGQPPLSHQIKDLETEVGTLLFHRLAHGAELTEAGRAFHAAVLSIPAQTERAVLAARRAARGEIGSLKVGFTGSMVFGSLVPASIRAFKRSYPDVKVTLDEYNSSRLTQGLHDDDIDVAFLRAPPEGIDGLQIRGVIEEPLVAMLPVDHPAAKQENVALTDLRHDSLILFGRTIGPLFDIVVSACRKAGFEPRLGQDVMNIGSIVNLVAAEFGVSLVPWSMQRLHVDGIVVRELAGEVPTIRLAIAHRRGDASQAVRNFVALATRMVEDSIPGDR